MNPRLSKFRKKSLIYVVIVSPLIILLSFILPALRTPSLDIFKFPLSLLTLIRREVGGIIFYHRNLIQAESLKKETDLLKQKLNAANETLLENKRLKSILSFKQKSAYKVIAARVIGRTADNWSSVIIIDKGSLNGIKQGYIAISYLGLVGRVIEITESTSKIMLINDPDMGISSQIQRSRQEGLACGTMGSFLVLRYLSPDSDIQISDVVITSGLTEMYPKGLLIGKVIGIGEELSGMSRYAIIKPAVNLSNIEEVLVIIP